VNSEKSKRTAFKNDGHTFRFGMSGWVLLLSLVASPCSANDEAVTADSMAADDANVFQLMRLLNQNEELLFEVEKLRGQVEELLQGAERSRKSQKIIAADFDKRLGQIEDKPEQDTSEDKTVIDALESRIGQLEEALTAMHAVITSTEQTQVVENPVDDVYEVALEAYRAGDYEAAIRDFRAFLEEQDGDAAAPNARYWLAEALLRQDDYETAIETGEILISSHPDSDKVPDTIFLLGKAHLAMGDALAARNTWETLVADYADTDAADKARDLLDRLP